MTNVLIDADELIYKACAAAEFDLEINGFHVLASEFATTQRIFCDQEAKICEALGASEVVMALSDKQNFRKEILLSYKANRSHRKPLAFGRLRQWVVNEYQTIQRPALEADDILGIFHPDFEYIASSDKDLLTIPTKVYSLHTDKVSDVSEAEANWNWLLQTLVGDRVDGYAGCLGAGPVKAQTILLRACESGRVPPEQLGEAWEVVVAAFRKAGMEEDALPNARVARILRPEDWDEETQTPILWTPK